MRKCHEYIVENSLNISDPSPISEVLLVRLGMVCRDMAALVSTFTFCQPKLINILLHTEMVYLPADNTEPYCQLCILFTFIMVEKIKAVLSDL